MFNMLRKVKVSLNMGARTDGRFQNHIFWSLVSILGNDLSIKIFT